MATLPGSSAGLKAVDYGGLINTDVMQTIFDISPIPLPFTDMIGSDNVGNALYEWTTDKLADPEVGGFVVDGADSDRDDTASGARIGNQAGILTREVRVTERAQASDTIGFSNALAFQVMRRQKELRRNVEANMLGIAASVADDGDTTAGVPAGFQAMAKVYDNGSGFTAGAYSGGGIWSAFVPGTAQALTFADVKAALSEAYVDNADPNYLMSVPGVIEKLSAYMFTNNESIATLQRDTNNVGKGGAATAVAAVNVLISNFGQTVTFVPNRIQQTYADVSTTTQAAGVMLLDPAYHRISMLKGYRTEPLAKTGLTDKRLMAVDWGQKVLNPEASIIIPDIDPTAAVTA